MLRNILWAFIFSLTIILTSHLHASIVVSTDTHFQTVTTEYIYESTISMTYIFPLTSLQHFTITIVKSNIYLIAENSTGYQTARAVEELLAITDNIQRA